jgi:tRNA dimethylallyltransferase
MMLDFVMILGPTAIGKTKLSIEVAQKFNGEIINGDAMQFYLGLDIGTAKIKEDEKQGIVHHLLDFKDPKEGFSVAQYQTLVREKISEIKARKNLPIVVGGSGLYLSAVYYDYQFPGEERDKDFEEKYKDTDTETLARILIETKPKLAEKVDLGNRRRILRALQKDESDLQEKMYPYYENGLIIGLTTNRKELYQRIDDRVDKMMAEGLVEEAKDLFDKGIESQATQAIGYKELFAYFQGETSLERAVEIIKQSSRRYAKRQMTWFKNKMDVNWFDVEFTDFSKTISEVNELIKKRS